MRRYSFIKRKRTALSFDRAVVFCGDRFVILTD